MGKNKPWLNEPDRLEFESHGFPCLIIRNDSGALCGYVGVDPKHPTYGKSAFYSDSGEREMAQFDLDVHGGITYANKCRGKICHTPKNGEKDHRYWIGFDCAHSEDIIPTLWEMEQPEGILYSYHNNPEIKKLKDLIEAVRKTTPDFLVKTYKDINYVKAECESLAEQLRAIA